MHKKILQFIKSTVTLFIAATLADCDSNVRDQQTYLLSWEMRCHISHISHMT